MNIEEQQQCEDKEDDFIDNPTLLDDLRTPQTSDNNHKRLAQSNDHNHKSKQSKLIKNSKSDDNENQLFDDIIKLNVGMNVELDDPADAIRDTLNSTSKSGKI